MAAPNSTSMMPSGDSGTDSIGSQVDTVTIVLLLLSCLVIVLRCVSRLAIVKRWSWDDTLIIAAWLLSFGVSFSILWGVRSGLGQHQYMIRPDQEVPLRQTIFSFSVLYNPVLVLSKSSILVFYIGLAGKTRRTFRIASIVTLIVVDVAGVALTLLNIFQCSPLGAFFLVNPPASTRCIDLLTIYLTSAPINIITDLAILVLPLPILASMRLPRRQKIILVATFSFGVFTTVVDVVRIAYLQNSFYIRVAILGRGNAVGSGDLIDKGDFFYYSALSFMWTAVEVNVGIICACVPTLKPLAARILPGLLRDTSDPNDVSRPTQYSMDSVRMKPLEAATGGGRAFCAPLNLTTTGLNSNDPTLPNSPTTPHPLDKDFALLDDIATPGDPSSSSKSGSQDVPMSPLPAEPTPRRGHKSELALFDFYHIDGCKSLVKLTVSESIWPNALVTVVFFIWGFAYGLLDNLNSQFAVVVGLNRSQLAGLHAVYYAAYFFSPILVGRYILTQHGFRPLFITGLCVYGVGTLIFWPSAVLFSFTPFIISNFTVGCGVALLETASNPFIALCGPPQWAEVRLCLSQAIQAVGTVLASLLAGRVLFVGVTDANSLINAQWTYLAIAFFDAMLAMVFLFVKLPECSDKDLEEVRKQRPEVNEARLFGFKIPTVTIVIGVFSMFLYVGAQEAAGTQLGNYIGVVLPSSPNSGTPLNPATYIVICQTLFAIGRFTCTALQFVIQPRTVLLFLFLGMVLTSLFLTIPSVVLPFIPTTSTPQSASAVALLVMYEFFQSGTFPIIYAISLRGLGRHTKTGAVGLTAAISGGSVFPIMLDAARDNLGLPVAWLVVLVTMATGAIYPVYLCSFRRVRAVVDQNPGHDSRATAFVKTHAPWLRRRRKVEDSAPANQAQD